MWRPRPQFKVSSVRQEKLGIPGLQGDTTSDI